MNRRRFVSVLVPAGCFTALATVRPGCRSPAFSGQEAAGRLRILMLGGTNFVGPALVQAALGRGHEVTLFNRGITNPHLFPNVEKLLGDRYPKRGGGLSALETTRGWDAVVDTWQAEPGCVDLTARMLAERTGRYLYISSIATYRHYREVALTEEGPLLDAGEHIASFDSGLGYAVRKRAGEQAVERIYRERGTVLRCTSIQGSSRIECPESNSEVGYWGHRFLTAGPVLAPDDGTAAFQLIDVNDMAVFAIRAVEQGFGGAFNMVGPEEPLLLREYVEAWDRVTEHRSEIVWADPTWLREQGVRVFEDIRNWIPADVPEPGFYRISNRKALAHGLVYRPLEDTLRDGIACVGEPEQLPAPQVGMSRERELELIRAWENRRG